MDTETHRCANLQTRKVGDDRETYCPGCGVVHSTDFGYYRPRGRK